MQKNKQIGHILFNKIFLGYVLIAIIFTSYHIYMQYSLAKNTIIKDMKTIEKAFHTGLANSLWHLDEKQINSNTQAIESIHGIIGISIISAKDEVFSQKGTLSLEDKKYQTFLYERNKNILYSNGLIKHTFSVIHEEFSQDEILGFVNIYTSQKAIYKTVQDSMMFILVYSIIIIMALWILFNHFAKRLLTNPLHQIIQATQELNIKEYKEISLIHTDNNRSELNTLVDTFNIMSKRIYESFCKSTTLANKLKSQKQELIQANKYQTDFLANMSHELKTPLNSINILSSVMAKNNQNILDDKHIKNLNIINKSGQDLLLLINDILDVSKIEAGNLAIELQKTNMTDLINELYDSMKPLAQEKNIFLTKNIETQDAIIHSDPKRIKQIIQNLLSNAIKFTTVGVVELTLNKDKNYIIIEVIDSGIGIPSNKMENIFDRFKQVDGSTTRKYGGTGLGLAISKELAHLLGSELSVTSMIQKGSVFTLRIPLKTIIANITDDKIEIGNNNDTRKSTGTDIELFENNINMQKEKMNVLLCNNNPIEFFPLTVALKKLEKINLIQVKTEDEIMQYIDDRTINLVILDADILPVNISKFSNLNTKIIGISTKATSDASIDLLIKKPIDTKLVLEAIDKLKKEYYEKI